MTLHGKSFRAMSGTPASALLFSGADMGNPYPRLVEERTIRALDGTELYARRTRGPEAHGLPIVCCNGIGVSTFFWKYVERHFAPERPVILWDYRGHGQSGHPPTLDNLTIEQNADDLRARLEGL